MQNDIAEKVDKIIKQIYNCISMENKFAYRAVVFDLDGTLLDTLTDLTSADNYMLSALGYPTISRETVASYMGNGIKQLIRLSLPGGEGNPRFNEAYSLYLKRYISHCDDNTAPYAGIMDMLRTLNNSGVKTAVVSNKKDEATRELCKKHFPSLISVAVGEREDEGIRKKPFPDAVFSALSILGVKKEDAVYVGDTEVDIATAKNCGIPCVSVSWGFRPKSFLLGRGASPIADDSAQLLKILAKK